MITKIRIATRKSPLAVWQAEYVAAQLQQISPGLDVELLRMVTQGDKLLDSPLAKIGGKGLFVKELEHGLLDGSADIAVHSMKDVPVELPDGLGLTAFLQREDPTDALVSNHYASLDELPQGARVGSSSLRRRAQLLVYRPDLKIEDLRGNVNTRLAKLDQGDYDAIILASSGLKRLGFGDRIRQLISVDLSLPAIGQGVLGIESCIDNCEITELLSSLNHSDTAIRITAERAMNRRLQGGCQVPIAGYAELTNQGEIYLRGLVADVDGKRVLRAEGRAALDQSEQLGYQVADELLAQGAAELLAEINAV